MYLNIIESVIMICGLVNKRNKILKSKGEMILLFKDLNIIEPIQRALKSEGYTKATPIQEKSIPSLLKGKDLLGCAQTGTGKTASFAIPILQSLSNEQRDPKQKRQIKALI